MLIFQSVILALCQEQFLESIPILLDFTQISVHYFLYLLLCLDLTVFVARVEDSDCYFRFQRDLYELLAKFYLAQIILRIIPDLSINQNEVSTDFSDSLDTVFDVLLCCGHVISVVLLETFRVLVAPIDLCRAVTEASASVVCASLIEYSLTPTVNLSRLSTTTT